MLDVHIDTNRKRRVVVCWTAILSMKKKKERKKERKGRFNHRNGLWIWHRSTLDPSRSFAHIRLPFTFVCVCVYLYLFVFGTSHSSLSGASYQFVKGRTHCQSIDEWANQPANQLESIEDCSVIKNCYSPIDTIKTTKVYI